MRSTLAFVTSLLLVASAVAQPAVSKGTKEPYDWAPAMRELTKEFKGKPGMVLRLGDSITYANPGSAYLRYGKGRTPEQLAVCRWMNAGENGKSNGIWLSIADQPGGRSFTAASGVTTAQYLQGGKGGLPKLDDIVKEHQPQIACVLLGTNDIGANVAAVDYAKNMETIVGKLLANKTIPVLITVPPIQRNPEAAVAYNERLREIGARHKLPVIDYHGEILARRPKDWLGTVISKDGVHPSAGETSGPATETNLSGSGYLLLGWATLNKLAEIKKQVIDAK
jgi:lysophospholipase L1-like esterase